ncbi:MAG TPA: hypothetical protein VMF06_10965 [Candidatus Limnocylindria bacterium]|jgi:hypothetical protein|nr:hypothetical protein [Candidatus Limnocylindria bacterium]
MHLSNKWREAVLSTLTGLSPAGVGLLLVCLAGRGWAASPPEPLVLFQTGFESFEGYAADQDLVASDGHGQNGWVSYGYAGNGILAGPHPDFTGQYAYIGFTAGQSAEPFNLWRPINLVPQPGSPAVVTFKVSFAIADSTTQAPYFDDFRWSVYTKEGKRLLTLDFNNDDRNVYFALDDGKAFVSTGFGFANDEAYDLVLAMNFARNKWTARINGAVVVNGQPLTTRGTALNLGDIDAVWALRDVAHPGDNYMIFDDYRVEAQAVTDIPSTLVPQGFIANGAYLLKVLGEPGVTYAVESSPDLVHWNYVGQALAQSPGGVALVEDSGAKSAAVRYYRAYSQP